MMRNIYLSYKQSRKVTIKELHMKIKLCARFSAAMVLGAEGQT